MDRQEARERLKSFLKDYVETITTKSKGANMYVCPICKSGSGKNATGAFSIKDGTSWKCFSCNAGGDILDLYGSVTGATDHNEQLNGLCQMYGITIDSYLPAPEGQKQDETEQYTHDSIHTTVYTQQQTDKSENYRDFFLQAHSHIKETDYWKQRGLTEATINLFKLGYVAEWRHPKAPKAPASPRLIIPTSPYSYLARDTRETIPEEQRAYSKSKVGSIQLFNKKALQTATKPIFIVEGELDALSIIEVGGEAVALGTTTKSKALIELLKAQAPAQALIIALDNDEAGQRTSRELTEGLQGLDIPFYVYNPCGEHKDANEALQDNREEFAKAVSKAEHLQEAEEQEQKEAYLKTSAAYYLQSFINGIADSVNTPYITTGFNKLDEALEGGLYEGLYVIGAISSLGKTTLIAQIADQIAQNGNDVLIFSLEMSKNEIMAKSISRHTLQMVLETNGDIKNAKTARGITTGSRYQSYNQTERELITRSIKNYSQYARNIYISEGVGDIGVTQIRESISQHILYTGRTPVVIIDYLQILAPYSERATDKQNTDKAVLELKRISRDFKLPLLGISSFNRANYKEAVTMEAFKESGAIEYSSDVLIGLQLKGAGNKDFDVTEAKTKNPREIELVILKNRNGRTGSKLSFNFYPMFNYFVETL